MLPLLDVDSALEKILAQVSRLDAETVSLPEALDRVVADDIKSPLDLPPFDNSAMDGYALHWRDSETASRAAPIRLPVVMDIKAGDMPDRELRLGEAARIMTGAPLPRGASAIVPVEDTDEEYGKGEFRKAPKIIGIMSTAAEGQYIRRAGENIKRGATVVKAGAVIQPAELGMLAAVGCAKAQVFRRPKVVILSSGDELVDVHQPLAPGKIRDTNSYTLAALIRQGGGIPIRLPIAEDTLESVRSLYRRALEIEPDLIISSAGVSVGAADFVKLALDELGDIDFWRINMRPGKPLAFGSLRGVPFFGLPGNPVSTMVTYEILVKPALAKIAGRPHKQVTVKATLAEAMRSDGRRSYNRVALKREGDRIVASSTGIQSSGALMSMILADGLAVIPEGEKLVPAGAQLDVIALRPFD